jgi:hypothetical protein
VPWSHRFKGPLKIPLLRNKELFLTAAFKPCF